MMHKNCFFVKRNPGETPGPPIIWSDPQNPEDAQPGYGYVAVEGGALPEESVQPRDLHLRRAWRQIQPRRPHRFDRGCLGRRSVLLRPHGRGRKDRSHRDGECRRHPHLRPRRDLRLVEPRAHDDIPRRRGRYLPLRRGRTSFLAHEQ